MLIYISAFCALILYRIWRKYAVNKKLLKLAGELGLPIYDEHPDKNHDYRSMPYLEGRIDGRKTRVIALKVNSFTGSQPGHAIQMLVNDLPELRFHICAKAGPKSKPKDKSLVRTYTGHAVFDNTLILRSNDPTLAAAIFSCPHLGERISQLFSSYKIKNPIELLNGFLHYESRGFITNEASRNRAREITLAMADISLALQALGKTSPDGMQVQSSQASGIS